MNQDKMQMNPALCAAIDRSKGALIWFTLVSCGCFMLWNASKEPQGALERAQVRAVQAVEWSLAGESEKLNQVMTPQAVAQAAADRGASGLDRALAASGQSVKARAEALEASLDGGQWAVRGLTTATLSGLRNDDPWRGAWEARLNPDTDGKLHVSSLRMSSLPAGAPYDVHGVALALRPPVIAAPAVEPAAKTEPVLRSGKKSHKSKSS